MIAETMDLPKEQLYAKEYALIRETKIQLERRSRCLVRSAMSIPNENSIDRVGIHLTINTVRPRSEAQRICQTTGQNARSSAQRTRIRRDFRLSVVTMEEVFACVGEPSTEVYQRDLITVGEQI